MIFSAVCKQCGAFYTAQTRSGLPSFCGQCGAKFEVPKPPPAWMGDPEKKCAKCGRRAVSTDNTGRFACEACGHRWGSK